MRLVVVVSVFSIVALLTPCLGATANPIPMPHGGGDPSPTDTPLDIIFKSEKVVYTIENEEVAHVSAIYTLINLNDGPVSLNVSLPFEENVPEDLRLSSNANPVGFVTFGSDSLRYSDYSYARFKLDFAACETLNLKAAYTHSYSVYSDWYGSFLLGTGTPTKQHFWCRYIAITARYWNNSLDSAEFQFRIKKDLYGSGLDGFNIREDDGYIVASQKYTNWTPNENINARWERLDIGMTILAHWFPILILCGVITIVAVYIATRHRRMKKQALRAWRRP